MQSFTIRDIENLTGIRAHTLRIWEQRYKFFTPKRKESRHRFYDNEDLKQLLRVSFLYHNGWKISKIASLTEEEIMEEVVNTKVAEQDYERFMTRLLAAAVDFDENEFKNLLDEIISAAGFENCIVKVCYPYLRKLGLLWSTNHVIPAQEHFSSYLIQNRIIFETEKLPHTSNPPSILLICPEGEYHELPLLFINYLLRRNHWSTLYLGANIRKEEWLQLSTLPGIKYLYLHLITNFTGFYPDDYLEDVCRSLPDKKIVASGEGIRMVQRHFVNLELLTSDAMIHDFIGRSGS
jgi:DNA-binding transcriptional MerR regulator